MSNKILAILGSIRKDSTNELIIKAIADLYPEILEIEIYQDIDKLPYFNPDLTEDNMPDIVKEFYKRISDVDGVIICTPEYVFSLPGILKNSLEWTVSTTVFSEKPFAFIVASSSGEKAFTDLELIMKTLGAKFSDNSKLLIKGPKTKINEQGKIINSDLLKQIDLLVDSLIRNIEY